MESIKNINTEYVLFIKNFLINFGYITYCKIVYEQITDTDPDNYKTHLIDYLDDYQTWDKIFFELNYPFKYFHSIMTNKEIYDDDDNDIILNSKTSNTYELQTFQEYIDSAISMRRRICPSEYTTFIKNMEYEQFRNNLISAYEIETSMRILKNKLIYLIKLQIKYMTYNIKYLTETEQNEIINYLDIIPFFEYLGKNKWNQETIDNSFENITIPLEYFEFFELEQKTLAIISSKLL